MIRMDYLEDEDVKRCQRAVDAEPSVRLAATMRPSDAAGQRRTPEEHRATLKHWRDLSMKPAITIPLLVGLLTGLILYHSTKSGLPRQLAEGLVVGGILSGGFAWSQAVSSELASRRALRLQLGLGSDLRLADLAGANLSHAYLRGRQLAGVKLSGARLFEADLTTVNLRDARLTEVVAFGSSFEGADLTAIGGYKADFRTCKMQNVVLQGAALCWADFGNADLRNADLRNADLRGADLTGADLAGAKLDGCWFTRSTKWPAGYESKDPQFDRLDSRNRILKMEASTGEAPEIDLRDRIDFAAGNGRESVVHDGGVRSGPNGEAG